MTVHALSHVLQLNVPSACAKLLLIYFADCKPGLNRFDIDRAAQFCCEPTENVFAALVALVHAGHVIMPSAEWVGLAYQDPEPEIVRPTYIKQSLPSIVRRRIRERDGHACVVCKTTKDLTVDHIHPESKGGTHDDNNLQTLCRVCNSRKGVKI